MANNVNETYGRGAVFGSLAYDFNHPELYAGEEEYSQTREPEQQQKTETRVQTRTRPRANPAARSKQGIAPFALIGVFAAAFLTVTAITAQVSVVNISGESIALQSRLAELEEEQTRLRIAYESAFNLAEIEEFATTNLGMQKPNAAQITYIDTSAPDKAVVIGGTEGDSFADRAGDFLSGLGSYFG